MTVPRDTSATARGPVSQTRDDLADWLTKAEAAAALGVSTKAVERLKQAGQLEQRQRPQARGPKLAVYHPDDVARLASQRRPGPSTGFVVPESTNATGPANGRVPGPASQALAVGIDVPPGADLLRLLISAAVQIVSETSQTHSSEPKIFLTLREAATHSGLSVTYLRRRIAAGTLKAIRDRSWKIRRTDLEQIDGDTERPRAARGD